jgi:hypothetical protein
MKSQTLLIALAMVVGSPLASVGQDLNALSAKEKAEGWILLFDGKTLNGWHSTVPTQGRGGGRARGGGAPKAGAAPRARAAAQPGAMAQVGSSPAPCVTAAANADLPPGGSRWEVVDGLLTPCGDATGYLTTDQSFRNSILSIEFKTGEDTNSGVFVRAPEERGGYEVQIWKVQPEGYNTGGIVGTGKTAREFNFKPDQWNRFEITADGDRLIVVLNGETTLDVRDARFAYGNIRLQYQRFPIAFRNIKLRPLKD